MERKKKLTYINLKSTPNENEKTDLTTTDIVKTPWP